MRLNGSNHGVGSGCAMMESTTGFSLTTHTVFVFRFLKILLVNLWINHFPIARIFSLLMNPVLDQKIELKKYNHHSIVWAKWYIAVVCLVGIITRVRFGFFLLEFAENSNDFRQQIERNFIITSNRQNRNKHKYLGISQLQ